MVPKNILELLYLKDISFITIDQSIATSVYGKITSQYIHDKKLIVLHEKFINDMIVLHEIGHFFSYNYKPFFKISDTEEFKEIYEKEKDIIFPHGSKFIFNNFSINYDYLKSNAEEYFAEVFSMYILDMLPKDTETYKYISNLINSY